MEIIDVKRGFARNYLIANTKALYAPQNENISRFQKLKQNYQKKIMKKNSSKIFI